MKRTLITLLLVIGSFFVGYAVKTLIVQHAKSRIMKKVTGIGGIFFKCKDPKMINEWYSKHLGLPTGPYGATFEWFAEPDSSSKGQTQWSPFSETTDYFAPSEKDFMINYRVDDLEGLVAQLKTEGIHVLDSIATYDYGKFIHLLDPEGNKIELWEPPQNE